MYTHARQFPHLAGKSDAEIRELARRALARHPQYSKIARYRNGVLLIAMGVMTLLLLYVAELSPGVTLIVSGAAFTLVILVWNFVWINRVLYRITKQEMDQTA